MSRKATITDRPAASAGGRSLFGPRAATAPAAERLLTRKRLINAEGELRFRRGLELTVEARDGHYAAAAPGLALGAVGATEAEALEMLEELIVASYLFYVRCAETELHSSALPLRAAFEALVESAVEPR